MSEPFMAPLYIVLFIIALGVVTQVVREIFQWLEGDESIDESLSVDLIDCPFCKRRPVVHRYPIGIVADKVRCRDSGCGAHFSYWFRDEWNRAGASK